jgi:acyl-CoA reductase-like NAD-dependent aldehyde dehydrogenase
MPTPPAPDALVPPQGAWGMLGAALTAAVWMAYALYQRVQGDSRASHLQSAVDKENADLIKRQQDEIAGLVEQRDKAYARADAFARERNEAIAEVAGLRKEVEAARADIQEMREHMDALLGLVNHLLFGAAPPEGPQAARLALLRGLGPALAAGPASAGTGTITASLASSNAASKVASTLPATTKRSRYDD